MSSRDSKSDLEQAGPRDPAHVLAERADHHARPDHGGGVLDHRATATEEMFRMLVESVRDYAIFMLDTRGRVVTWNTGAERLKGYQAGEIIGRHFSAFYPADDIAAGRCETELAVAARDGRFEDEGWRVRKDGSLFWADVVISAVCNDRGDLVGFSKVTRDLTERNRAEDERAARRAAEQANRVKDQFLAVLGHELRNPLAPIVTALQLMKLRGDRSTLKEQQVIERQLGHMLRLVDDLLDVSRIVQGKIELKQQRIDLREVIARAIEIAGPLIEQRRHHFDVAIPAVPLVVHGDEARLTQVFTNLLVNAAKYTDPGGRVVIAVEDGDEDITVDVRDNGIGIDPALLRRIFDLWVQGYQGTERSRGGLGIGLTLVRTLVELHGGKVEARSEGAGRGSTFCVRIPRGETRHADAPAAAGVERIARELRRILLVDDNEDALVLLGDALVAAGHDVRTALDPESALQIARTFRPEVAILDIGLPTMDGYQLASRLRAELGDAQISMIALTGYGQPSDRHRSAEAGFDAHFVKPVDVQRLSDAIARS